jgi:hypothetical protein
LMSMTNSLKNSLSVSLMTPPFLTGIHRFPSRHKNFPRYKVP